MSAADNGIDQFLQAWAAEFARAMAPLLNEFPVVTCSRARHLSSIDLNGVLWCQAALEGNRPFLVWVGARETIWSVVGKLNWIRMMERVQTSTVAAVSPALLRPLTCGEAQVVYSTPDTRSLCYALIGIRLASTELPSLLFILEAAAKDELKPKNSTPVLTPMLQSLLNLELPLSVALGRTTLPIGEVLKITSGSVIHLSGHTGEEVEVLVHGTVVAKGQVVSTKGNYGVRIKEIISPTERLNLYTGVDAR